MRFAAAVEFVIRIAHRLRAPAAEHDLHIDRLEAVVLEAVNDPGRTGDAFPGPEFAADPPPVFVLEKDRQISLQDEKDFLDLVRMRRIALPWRHVDNAERKAARRDDGRIVVLARPAGADEAMLRAPVALDLGVLEGLPISRLLAEAPDIALGDLFEREPGNFRRYFVTGSGHRISSTVCGLAHHYTPSWLLMPTCRETLPRQTMLVTAQDLHLTAPSPPLRSPPLHGAA